jgi:hypothetical protein
MNQQQFYIGEPQKGYRTYYGVNWQQDIPLLQVNLSCFAKKWRAVCRGSTMAAVEMAFKAIARALWPEKPDVPAIPAFCGTLGLIGC